MKVLLVLTIASMMTLNVGGSSCPREMPNDEPSETLPIISRGDVTRLKSIDNIIGVVYDKNASESVLSFNPDDVTQPSGITAEYLELAIQDTGLSGYGTEYVNAEKNYNINAIFLISIVALESGWGESPLYEEKNNVSGFRAYDGDPYNSATFFVTKADSIQRTAEVLSDEYVGEGRFTIESIGDKYASDKEWASKVHSVALTILKRIENKR